MPLTAAGPHFYALRPDSTVGGEVYERELLARLPAHGIDLVVGLPADGHPPPGARVTRVPRPHWTRAPLAYLPFLVRALRGGRADLLRGHSVRYTGPALLLARALTGAQVPVVLHHHHLDPRWAELEARIAARADAVVAVSLHARAELVAAGVPGVRIHVIHEGVERPPPTAGLPGAWPGPGLRLLYLGRLEDRKRAHVALDALARLGAPASLVVAGDGPARSHLEARAAGLPVRFLGRVPDAEKWRLYDSADFLLFPSQLEGFGLVAAEAQSRGLPVIAAEGTATGEALGGGALVPSDGEAFAAALRELVPQREALATRARAHAARFDWDECAARVAALYSSLATPGVKQTA